MTNWMTTPTKTIDVDGTRFAYRELGEPGGVPVVFLHHFTAVLDDWDPRVLDGVASQHHVIAFDNRGVGATSGRVPTDIEQMGADAIAFVRALGHKQVDVIGFSLGGAVAQMVALQAPDLVRRMVVAGSGPRGGGGIWKMPFIVGGAYTKAFLSRKDPRHFLFSRAPRRARRRPRPTLPGSRSVRRVSTSRSRPRHAWRSCARSRPPVCIPSTTCRRSRSRSSSPTATRI